jgi:hypothetical protein
MKTQTEHTPSPWNVEECHNIDGSKFLTINGQGPHGAWLADIQAGLINGHPADVTEKHLANARLMAAAPELLEALRNLLATAEFVDAGNKRDGAERYGFAKSLFEQSRAAIAKATTEPSKP